MEASYREVVPHGQMSIWIERFWTQTIEEPTRKIILPDGCADIVFVTSKRIGQEASFVGVMTKPRPVSLDAGDSLCGIRFHPGMASLLLPFPLSSVNDTIVPLRTVVGDVADQLIWSFQESTSDCLERLQMLLSARPKLHQVQAAIRSLMGRSEPLQVSDLRSLVGAGERQLRRVCSDHSGLSPRELCATLRFRHVVAAIQNGGCHLSRLAYEAGYYDQAHLTREFRRLAEMTPGTYLASVARKAICQGMSDLYKTIAGERP